MENFDSIQTIELLVKLASLGAAGISILAVFIIGIRIFNLPNDTSAVKASVLKFYIFMCIFMAIICGFSSWANANFTYTKVKEAKDETEMANNNFKTLHADYQQEVAKVELEKQVLITSLNTLQKEIRQQPVAASPEVIRQIDGMKMKVDRIQIKPLNMQRYNVLPEREQ